VVGETRGLGLMQGVELVDTSETGPQGVGPAPDSTLAKHVSRNLRERGIVMGVGGFHTNVMRIQPPLSISRTQFERAIDGLEAAIEAER
jgi:4-aminobutyrate aminotransferase-like enzyme